MATMRTEEMIGQAWRKHREGRNNEAIQEFKEILQKTPDNVDAHYGLGLAQRAEGNTEDAGVSFKKAFDLTQNALKAVRTTASTEGVHGANDLESYADDRYMMLDRM